MLEWIIPEIYEGAGVSQPAFHHLDVFEHCLLTLDYIERIIADPVLFFSEGADFVTSYLMQPERSMLLKWAALFHDVGKPATKKIVPEKNNRITFYGHDREGALRFLNFAERLKWSRKHREFVSLLIDYAHAPLSPL